MTELLRATHLYAHADLPPARIGGARLAAARIFDSRTNAALRALVGEALPPQTPRWGTRFCVARCSRSEGMMKKGVRKTKDERNLRRERLYIRVNAHEVEAIRRYAERAGLTVSQYARKRLLMEPVVAALPEGFNELRRDIAGLCNNVNQIARAVHMNARDASRAASDARRYAGEVYQMLTEWMNRGV